MTKAKKNVEIFILQGGTWQRGNMAKSITVVRFIKDIFYYYEEPL